MANQTTTFIAGTANATYKSDDLLNISSVVPEKLPENCLAITARWKDSKDRIVPAANRNRTVVLQSDIWSSDENVTVIQLDALKLHLLDSLEELARSYLQTTVEESNWQRTAVNESAFSLVSLLSWQAEQAALNGRLKGEEIKAWIAKSATILGVKEAHGDAIAKALGDQFVKLASPNHGLTAEKAGKLLANLWKQEDCDSLTGLRVSMKLTAIRDKTPEPKNELDDIL